MDKVQHPTNNHVLGAPRGWDQGEQPCGALPVTRTHLNGQPMFASYWRPTPRELEALRAGALVVLYVVGEAHPPVALNVAEAS